MFIKYLTILLILLNCNLYAYTPGSIDPSKPISEENPAIIEIDRSTLLRHLPIDEKNIEANPVVGSYEINLYLTPLESNVKVSSASEAHPNIKEILEALPIIDLRFYKTYAKGQVYTFKLTDPAIKIKGLNGGWRGYIVRKTGGVVSFHTAQSGGKESFLSIGLVE